MYIYLGGQTVVNSKDVIGVFDMDTSTVNKATRDYLSRAEKNNKIIYTGYDLPKSFVVTDSNVIVCEINSNTIVKRINKK